MLNLPAGPLQTPIPNAAYPTAGQGLTLDLNGKLPQAVLQTLPGYVLGRQTFTSLITVASSTEATGTTIVTAPAFTADGTSSYWVEFYAPAFDITPSVAGQAVLVNVFEGSTQIGRLAQLTGPTTSLAVAPCFGRILVVAPSAASHTYVITAYKTNAAATAEVIGGAGGTNAYAPGYVQIIRA